MSVMQKAYPRVEVQPNPALVLGTAVEEAIRQIVREELAAVQTAEQRQVLERMINDLQDHSASHRQPSGAGKP